MNEFNSMDGIEAQANRNSLKELGSLAHLCHLCFWLWVHFWSRWKKQGITSLGVGGEVQMQKLLRKVGKELDPCVWTETVGTKERNGAQELQGGCSESRVERNFKKLEDPLGIQPSAAP